MARFVVEVGERVLRRGAVFNGGARELVLTDRRVALLNRASGYDRLFQRLGIEKWLPKGTIIDEIARPDLVGVDAVDDRSLHLARKGGAVYGGPPLTVLVNDAREWADQLHRWSAGILDSATLPPAKLVDR